MEAQAALVGANGHAVLHAIPTIDLNLAKVIHPRNTKHHGALWLHESLQQSVLGIARMFLNEGPQAFHDFGHGLQIFGLSGIAGVYVLQELGAGFVFHGSFCSDEKCHKIRASDRKCTKMMHAGRSAATGPGARSQPCRSPHRY